MAEAPQDLRRFNWSECCNFVHVFKSFRQAIHVNKLVFAFFGIVLTYSTGRLMDVIWLSSCLPAVDANGMTELAVFIAGGGDRAGTADWLRGLSDGDEIRRAGIFALMLNHVLVSANAMISAVLSVSPTGILHALRHAVLGVVWLVSMHWFYAFLFGLVSLLIWGFFGGALCRTAAMHATRDERITYGEAMSYACKRVLAFAASPLLPLVFVVIFGVLLFLGGLVGAIPAVGELLVGLLFFLTLLLGLAIAFILIGLAAGVGMAFPTIAVEGSDAFDALSRIGAYIYSRPWRTALYYLCALGHGAICIAFVKFLTRLMLWSVHFFVGFSMNWGGAFVTGSDSGRPPKLDAIWQAPAIMGDTPFYGSFGEVEVAHVSWFSQLMVKTWVYGVWGLVAAVAVSYFFCANTIIYLLLRREVDATDLEDVYLEDSQEDAAAPPPPPPGPPGGSGNASGSGGTSLPVIG